MGTPNVLTTLLRDVRTQPPTVVDAEVIIDFPDARFPDVEAAWSAERRQLLSAEHRNWDWLRKLGRPDYRYVAITLGPSVEGLMAVEKVPRPSQLTVGVSSLYVAFIEVAPWNLLAHPAGIRFRGTGKSLLAAACRMSHDDGLGGRVLLSALPQAESFYRACGMTECGPTYSLVYFEYSDAAATSFRARVGI
jgi:hypothetical protein